MMLVIDRFQLCVSCPADTVPKKSLRMSKFSCVRTWSGASKGDDGDGDGDIGESIGAIDDRLEEEVDRLCEDAMVLNDDVREFDVSEAGD